jgi:arylsulfatase A-like enzyme
MRTRALLAVLLVACSRTPPPSLVLVTLDTVRCDHLGIRGDPRGLSPHLDALAARGLVHTRAFTTMPTTGPAHASILTGLHPSEHGARANGEPVSRAAAARALPLALREAGYATAAFVTTDLLSQRALGLPGFDTYQAPGKPLLPGARAARAALAWLDAEPRRPVFLWLHLYDAHAPYGDADEKRRGLPLAPGRFGFVDPSRLEPGWRAQQRERYARGVREADAALGLLLDGLAQRFARPPLVVVAGDHGEALDEHLAARGYAFDHGEFLDPDVTCVPLVLAGPGVSGGRSTSAVSLRDLHPTLLRAAGLAAPADAPDLRAPVPGPRRVATERRRIGPKARSWVRRHAAAAYDAHATVIVGEGGEPFGAPAFDADPDLLAEARRHLVGPALPLRRPDAALGRALEALGYAEAP